MSANILSAFIEDLPEDLFREEFVRRLPSCARGVLRCVSRAFRRAISRCHMLVRVNRAYKFADWCIPGDFPWPEFIEYTHAENSKPSVFFPSFGQLSPGTPENNRLFGIDSKDQKIVMEFERMTGPQTTSQIRTLLEYFGTLGQYQSTTDKFTACYSVAIRRGYLPPESAESQALAKLAMKHSSRLRIGNLEYLGCLIHRFPVHIALRRGNQAMIQWLAKQRTINTTPGLILSGYTQDYLDAAGLPFRVSTDDDYLYSSVTRGVEAVENTPHQHMYTEVMRVLVLGRWPLVDVLHSRGRFDGALLEEDSKRVFANNIQKVSSPEYFREYMSREFLPSCSYILALLESPWIADETLRKCGIAPSHITCCYDELPMDRCVTIFKDHPDLQKPVELFDESMDVSRRLFLLAIGQKFTMKSVEKCEVAAEVISDMIISYGEGPSTNSRVKLKHILKAISRYVATRPDDAARAFGELAYEYRNM